MVTYPIYYIDKGLSLTPLKAVDHLGRLPVREDCLDERREFILGNGRADQALPRLFTGFGNDRWMWGIGCMLYRIKTRQECAIIVHDLFTNESRMFGVFEKTEVLIE